MSGIEAHYKQKDVADAIMSSMELHLGVKLPEDAKKTISKWTEKSYRQGLGQNWDDGKWKVDDKNALDFFERHDQHFFGKQFEHYSDDMRKVVEDELKGVSAYTPEVKKRMRDKLGDAFENPNVANYYDLCIRNAVNKSRNYGRTFQYERLGIAEVEVVAILDRKTSEICRTMNGRRIEVKMLAEYVRETLETPMDELTEKFAWPSNKDAAEYAEMSTDEIMSKIKCKLPPYHGRCRTTTVIAKSIKVKKAGGGVFSGDVSYDKNNTIAKQRADVLKKLNKDELLSKTDSLVKTSWWDKDKREWRDGTTRTSYEYHKAKHGKEFNEDYDIVFKKLLKNYGKVYTFGLKPEWIFFDPETGAFLHLNDDGSIIRFHRFDKFKPKKVMVEIQ